MDPSEAPLKGHDEERARTFLHEGVFTIPLTVTGGSTTPAPPDTRKERRRRWLVHHHRTAPTNTTRRTAVRTFRIRPTGLALNHPLQELHVSIQRPLKGFHIRAGMQASERTRRRHEDRNVSTSPTQGLGVSPLSHTLRSCLVLPVYFVHIL